ncbi:MAG: serine/threonine-protein kinase, partial [Planctomycetota bacterium]
MGSPEHFAPGARLGHLKIERELGEGAFATVWLAVDTLIGRQVALKVMRGPAAIATAEERERILREARLVANLKSPHLVTLYRIHDLTYAGWIVEMEYVDGGSLDDLLRERGRLDAGDVLRIVRGVLLGLQEAHRRKVVHRDVKPGNVLLGKDGSVKLTDFGLGRHLGEASLSASSGSQIL